MNTNSPNFPGGLRHAKAGYDYYLPGDIFQSQEITLPFSIIKQTEEAGIALGRFASLTEQLPDPLFIIGAFSKQEARFSTQIEGTQTDVADAFIKQKDVPSEKRDDWAELHAYIDGLNAAVKELGENLPLCNRLLKDTHKILLSQVRGKSKSPGEFRKSQNWIGGSRPNNAHFVPPAHEHIADVMSNLEKFIQDDQLDIPHLIRAALIHAQFETIHPFLDGNGRMGRMLVSLYLLEKKLLQHPILYISHFFENHRQSYYMALDQSRKNIDGMIKWVSFFLDAVTATANNGIAVTRSIITHHKELSDSTIPAMGKRAPQGTALLNLLFQSPVINAREIQNSLEYSAQATQKLLNDFTDNGILREITGNRRNRIYVFEQYLKLIKMDND